MTSGVYQIKNTVNGKVYVGSSANIEKRWREHTRHFRVGDHHCEKLQHAVAKHGIDSFELGVIEVCEPEDCLSREQYWLDAKNTIKDGYNTCPVAGSRLGSKTRPEVAAKISAANKGKVRSPESRKNVSDGLKGHKLSDNVKAALLAANLGRPRSEETRRKTAETRAARRAENPDVYKKPVDAVERGAAMMRGRKMGQAQIEKMRARRLGKTASPETRAKMSAAMKGRVVSPEAIEKMLATRRANAAAKKEAPCAYA